MKEYFLYLYSSYFNNYVFFIRSHAQPLHGLSESLRGKEVTQLHILYFSVLYLVCQLNCPSLCLEIRYIPLLYMLNSVNLAVN